MENPYDLRNETMFKSRNVHTVQYGIETASFVAPRIWSSIPRSYKECSSVNEFKAKFKFWYPEICTCNLLSHFVMRQLSHFVIASFGNKVLQWTKYETTTTIDCPNLHLSNRLYIEHVTCHLLMLLLSARACSETAKRNSVCFEISFDELVSYRNQPIDLRYKLVDCFLCDA